jgi:hypothetical protein
MIVAVDARLQPRIKAVGIRREATPVNPLARPQNRGCPRARLAPTERFWGHSVRRGGQLLATGGIICICEHY